MQKINDTKIYPALPTNPLTSNAAPKVTTRIIYSTLTIPYKLAPLLT